MSGSTWRFIRRGKSHGRDCYLFVRATDFYQSWVIPVDAFWGKR